MKMEKSLSGVRILLESAEDVWFWERRFNVFDFLELFPPDAVSSPAPEGQNSSAAAVTLTFDTDTGFSFETDIVRGGFYLRNQSQGTRKWMATQEVTVGDTIELSRIDDTHYHLRKIPGP